jgi:hypothetical protein
MTGADNSANHPVPGGQILGQDWHFNLLLLGSARKPAQPRNAPPSAAAPEDWDTRLS